MLSDGITLPWVVCVAGSASRLGVFGCVAVYGGHAAVVYAAGLRFPVPWLRLGRHERAAQALPQAAALGTALQALPEAVMPPRGSCLIWHQGCGKLALGGAAGDRRRPMYMRP